MANGETPKLSPPLLINTEAENTSEIRGSSSSISSGFSFKNGQLPNPFIITPGDEARPGMSVPGQMSAANPILSTQKNSTQPLASGDRIPTDKISNQGSRDQLKKASRVCAVPPTAKDEKTHSLPSKALGRKRSLVKLKRTSIPILLCFASICLLITVIIYVQSTYGAESSSSRGLPLSDLLKTDVSKTLTVVRTSQGILSALTSLALENIFFLLQWSQIHPPNGLSYLRILALSPTTGGLGTLQLLKSSAPGLSTKFWALTRLTMTALVWFSGLALFFNTSIITAYDTVHSYNVTAGVGPFNGSLVQPFRDFLHNLAPTYQYETLPYSYFAAAYTLVVNPLVSVVAETNGCSNNLCASYILSGGLEMVIPWVPQGYEDHSMVMVKNVPSIQVDFTGPTMDEFSDSDCDIFGETRVAIGIRLCLTRKSSDPGSIRAGVFVCEQGIDNGTCNGHHAAANITTEVSFHTLQSSIVTARSNHSILGVTDSTEPVPILDLDLAAYRDSLRWLLNYTAADLPPPSSIAQSFWSAEPQLQNPATWGIQFQNFQSILVFPFWLFNANNWGNTQTHANTTVPTLPPEFYTKASIVEPYAKIRFQPAMFALFLVLQVLSLLFVGGVVVWAWTMSRMPLKTSSFPLFDIAFRAEVQSDFGNKGLDDLNDSEIVHLMRNAKAVGRSQV